MGSPIALAPCAVGRRQLQCSWLASMAVVTTRCCVASLIAPVVLGREQRVAAICYRHHMCHIGRHHSYHILWLQWGENP